MGKVARNLVLAYFSKRFEPWIIIKYSKNAIDEGEDDRCPIAEECVYSTKGHGKTAQTNHAHCTNAQCLQRSIELMQDFNTNVQRDVSRGYPYSAHGTHHVLRCSFVHGKKTT